MAKSKTAQVSKKKKAAAVGNKRPPAKIKQRTNKNALPSLSTGYIGHFPLPYALGPSLLFQRTSLQWRANEYVRISFTAYQEGKKDRFRIMGNAIYPEKGGIPTQHTAELGNPLFTSVTQLEAAQILHVLREEGTRISKHNKASNTEFAMTPPRSIIHKDGRVLIDMDKKKSLDEAVNLIFPLPAPMPEASPLAKAVKYNFKRLHKLDPFKQEKEWEALFPFPKLVTTKMVHTVPAYYVSALRDRAEDEKPSPFYYIDGPIKVIAAKPESSRDLVAAGDEDDDVDDPVSEEKEWQKKNTLPLAADWQDGVDRGESPGKINRGILGRNLDEPLMEVTARALAERSQFSKQFIAVHDLILSPDTINEPVPQKDGTLLQEFVLQEAWYIYSLDAEWGLVPLVVVRHPKEEPWGINGVPVTPQLAPENNPRTQSYQLFERTLTLLRNLEEHDLKPGLNYDIYHRFIDNDYSMHYSHFLPLVRKVTGSVKDPN